jgi:heat shock protein HslJ
MRKKSMLFALGVVLAMTACDTTKSSTQEVVNSIESKSGAALLVGAFTIGSIAEKDYSSKSLVLTFDSENNSVHGTTECNGISSSYEIRGNQITFGPVISTRMYCEGKMDAESEMAQALGETVRFSVNDQVLYLYNKEGNILLTATK